MRLYEIYDNNNSDNLAAYNSLPVLAQYFVTTQQKLLCEKIDKKVLETYGPEAIKSLNKIAGFYIASNDDNCVLHTFGMAADFAKTGLFAKVAIPTCCNLICLDKQTHWHVQFKK